MLLGQLEFLPTILLILLLEERADAPFENQIFRGHVALKRSILILSLVVDLLEHVTDAHNLTILVHHGGRELIYARCHKLFDPLL